MRRSFPLHLLVALILIMPFRISAAAQSAGTPVPGQAVGSALRDSATAGSYDGTLYDYSLRWDAATWDVWDEVSDIDTDGIQLVSDTGALTIWTTPLYRSSPASCLRNEADVFDTTDPTVSGWRVADNRAGDPITDELADYAYGVFTFSYFDDTTSEIWDAVDYIECRPIPNENAQIVIFASARADQFNAHIASVLEVSATITFPAGPTTGVTDAALLQIDN